MNSLHTPEALYNEVKRLLLAFRPKKEFVISIKIDLFDQQKGQFYYWIMVSHYIKSNYGEQKRTYAQGGGDSAEEAIQEFKDSLNRRQTAYSIQHR